MCTFLVLLIPSRADREHAIAVAREHGFEPGIYDRGDPHLPEQHRDMALFDPDGAHCHCGTSIGRSFGEPRHRESVARKARRGRRAKWAESKRQAWIEQQLGSRRAAPGLSRGAVLELDRWLALAEAALADPRIGRIGVVVQEFNERVSDWRPAVEARASLQTLQEVARLTPTWLTA